MKMFKILILLILLTLTQSCKDDKLVDFARNVIKHPETLYDLQTNYPEFFNENYIHTNWQDSAVIKQVYHAIELYNNVDASEEIKLIQADGWEIMLNRAKASYTIKDYYLLIFQKNERQIIFYLIKKDERYYIHFISGGIDAKYLYFHQSED